MKHQVKEKISQTPVRSKLAFTYEACIMYIVLFVQTPTQTRSLSVCCSFPHTNPLDKEVTNPPKESNVYTQSRSSRNESNKKVCTINKITNRNHPFHVRSMTDNAGESEKTRAGWQVLCFRPPRPSFSVMKDLKQPPAHPPQRGAGDDACRTRGQPDRGSGLGRAGCHRFRCRRWSSGQQQRSTWRWRS
jgi:hypothetical protein